MPTFEATAQDLSSSSADVLVVPATAGADEHDAPVVGPGVDALVEALGIDLVAELQALDFDAASGSVARVPTRGAVTAETVLVVGLGAADELGLDDLRLAGAAVARATSRTRSLATSVASAGGLDPAQAAQALVEGILLGAYAYTGYKSDTDPHRLEAVTLHGADADLEGFTDGASRGAAVAAAVGLARDLVNQPPGDKRPPAFADLVVAEFADTAVEVRVLDEDALLEGGYGGILGVGAGSTAPPRLVELSWAPAGASSHVALVGKGITFDSGGLSLKPNASMETMKMDMGGAAAVLAVVKAAAALELPVRITGLLALAENMPSGTAIRPSDVLTIRGGTTVEVMNTDAEGRLVLADALVHASELAPDAIVDVATLTGAVKTALGPKISAVMATDDTLADELLAAAACSGEPMWRMPLPSDLYGSDLKGDVADLKNSGWDGGGTIRAGLFLKEFVTDGIPWAHLDIAGVAWADTAEGYLAKGATGAPVRTLVDWLRRR